MRQSGSQSDGFALVIVLGILAILTVLALGFGQRALTERQAAAYALDRAQALAAARGAVAHATLQLRAKLAIDRYEGREGYTGLDQHWARRHDLWDTSMYFRIASDPRFESDVCEYWIEDASAKLSINSAPKELLERLPGMERGVVHEIVTRRSATHAGEQPWHFESLEDVRVAIDADDSAWYGDEDGVGLRDMISAGDGLRSPRINLNTAGADVIATIPNMDDDVIEGMMAYRMGSDGIAGTADDRAFRAISQMGASLDVPQNKLNGVTQYGTVHSTNYVIRTRATRRDGAIEARCDVTVAVRGTRVTVLQWSEDAGAG